MPLVKLNFLPGFHRESTQYAEKGKWFDGNRVRFREGKPENLRGYVKHNTDSINGEVRDLLSWADNDTRPHIILGSNKEVLVEEGQEFYDVTPIVSVVSASNNLGTTANSVTVSVNIANHGLESGDRIIFQAAATVGDNIVLTSSSSGGPIFAVVTAPDLARS